MRCTQRGANIIQSQYEAGSIFAFSRKLSYLKGRSLTSEIIIILFMTTLFEQIFRLDTIHHILTVFVITSNNSNTGLSRAQSSVGSFCQIRQNIQKMSSATRSADFLVIPQKFTSKISYPCNFQFETINKQLRERMPQVAITQRLD